MHFIKGKFHFFRCYFCGLLRTDLAPTVTHSRQYFLATLTMLAHLIEHKPKVSPRQQHCYAILCNLLKFITITSSFENPLLIAPPVDHCLVSHSACFRVMLNRYKKTMLIQSTVFATLFRNSRLCFEILRKYKELHLYMPINKNNNSTY